MRIMSEYHVSQQQRQPNQEYNPLVDEYMVAQYYKICVEKGLLIDLYLKDVLLIKGVDGRSIVRMTFVSLDLRKFKFKVKSFEEVENTFTDPTSVQKKLIEILKTKNNT